MTRIISGPQPPVADLRKLAVRAGVYSDPRLKRRAHNNLIQMNQIIS